ncbi:MAG TPA: translation elongation factor Ts [Bacteroidales bacterium]|nr:elongation factor Ts [Bacteroidales bacterium]HNZ43315.1 translation elongation factor Ts [Bacteroidales bacterium]HOH84081.1 translation elongation factor Ts [Bacteroidales bacterium]HPB25308.1 translation elongation factor Ts [Bacteroidales bacterium]HPI29229.1 translation elongation factor Ts [Bacteroidales bacterium]
MANITAAEVNKLRQMTGAGMMDCKHALVECDGDYEKAIDYLRKKGQKVANKRADRETSEGLVIALATEDKKFGTITMLNCETDFVAKNQEFIDLANAIASLTLTNRPKSLEELKNLTLNNRSVAEHVSDYMGKTGEKIGLNEYQFIEAPRVFVYNHMGNKLASMLGFSKSEGKDIDQCGKDVAMQIAAMSPVAIDKDSVDQTTIDREIEIGKEQARAEGKPEDMLEKIAIGKLNKFFKDNTLVNQEFIKDSKKTVGQYLSECDKDLKITEFKRVSVKN